VTTVEASEIVAFSTADTVDTDSFHDNVTNNSRVTIPSSYDGYYVEFHVNIGFSGEDLAHGAIIELLKNGGAFDATMCEDIATSPGTQREHIRFHPLPVATGDYFEIRIYNRSVTTTLSCASPRLTMRVVSAPVGAQNAVTLPSYTNASRPAATAVQAGTAIWNTDDGFPNWSNGTNWVISDGTTT
jgi:hypothetical protein